MKKVLFVSLALALASTGVAYAAQGGGKGGNAACNADAEKYCSGKTGADRRSCLNDNKDKLSQACKDAMANAGGGKGGN